MNIHVLQTGSTLVSSAVPDRSSRQWCYAYIIVPDRYLRRFMHTILMGP